MAENTKDPIDKLAELRNVPRETIVEELRELDLGAVQPDGSRSGGFAELYQKGIFAPATFEGDRVAHEAFGKALGSDQDLFRAFDHYKRLNSGGKGIQEIIKEAGDSYGAGAGRSINELMPWAGDIEGEFNQFLYGPYGFTALADGTYVAPWLKEQAQEKIGPGFEESDLERLEREKREIRQRGLDLAEQQGAQNVFNFDQDPRISAVRRAVDNTKSDPFLRGTQGQRSIIHDLLDASSQKIPAPNLGDPRSVAKFNNSVSSREFVRNNALKKLRGLYDMADSRREIVNRHLGVMAEWEAANKGKHPMADKGVENWTDQQKINFVKNFNLGNFKLDDPAPATSAQDQAVDNNPAPAAPVANNNPAPAAAPAAPAPQNLDAPASNRFLSKEFLEQGEQRARELMAQQREGNAPKSTGQSILDAREDVLRSEAASRPPNTEDNYLLDHTRQKWRSRYGEKARERKALMDQRMRDREQMVKANAMSSQAEAAPRPGQQIPENRNVHDVIKNADSFVSGAPNVIENKKVNYMVQPTLDQPAVLPPQDPFTASDAKKSYDEIKAMRDMDEARELNQLNSQIKLANMQKSKAQNLADTKAYHNQSDKVMGYANDGTYTTLYDPNRPQAIKERNMINRDIQNSKSGDLFQDFMDETREEEERKRRQRQFAAESKKSPYYTNYFSS